MDKAKRRKYKSVTFDEKLAALKRLDNGETIKKVAGDLGVGSQTVGDWKKNRTKIEEYCSKAASSTGISERKRMRDCENPDLDSSLYLWFTQEREKGTPISGPLLQEKALSMNVLLEGDQSFTASSGWLDRFKSRHGIRQLCIAGEKLSADSEAVVTYKNEFKTMIADEDLGPDQIYNCDETGLYFKMLPGKTLASRIETSAPGLKKNKERVTVLACSNASGTHKLPLMVIGKSKKPHAFRHMNMNALPVHYRSQKSAWMNGFLFQEWFEDEFVPRVKKFLRKEKLPRRAVLLMDNAPSHPNDNELQVGNIKAIFLPPNVTALIQPMDQGILENFKRRYRHKLLNTLLEYDGEDKEDVSLSSRLKAVNMKTVVNFSSEAWDEIENRTLVKSWRKLWPEVEQVVLETRYDAIEEGWAAEPDEEAVNHTAVFASLFKQLPGCDDVTEEDVTEWVAGECEANMTSQVLSDEEIVNAVLQHANGDSDEDVDDPQDLSKVTHTDAMKALEVALSYVEQQPSSTPADVLMMKRWRNFAASKRQEVSQQRKITSFFLKE